jgi:hypothetical protein
VYEKIKHFRPRLRERNSPTNVFANLFAPVIANLFAVAALCERLRTLKYLPHTLRINSQLRVRMNAQIRLCARRLPDRGQIL